MKYAAKLLCAANLVFLPIQFCGAQSRCGAPPYGDSQQNYDVMVGSYARANQAGGLPEGFMTAQLKYTMELACKAKFEHGDRTKFYQAGFTDRDINMTSTSVLADGWFDSRNKALAKEHRATAQQRPPAQAQSGTTIYALLYCVNDNSCEIHGIIRDNTEVPFRTLTECQQQARANTGGRLPDKNGRTYADGSSWWECRGKHVETWDRPQGPQDPPPLQQQPGP
jgi:hypothetical protein